MSDCPTMGKSCTHVGEGTIPRMLLGVLPRGPGAPVPTLPGPACSVALGGHGLPLSKFPGHNLGLLNASTARQAGGQTSFLDLPILGAQPESRWAFGHHWPLCSELQEGGAKAFLQAAKLLDKHRVGIGFLQRGNQIRWLTAPGGQGSRLWGRPLYPFQHLLPASQGRGLR